MPAEASGLTPDGGGGTATSTTSITTPSGRITPSSGASAEKAGGFDVNTCEVPVISSPTPSGSRPGAAVGAVAGAGAAKPSISRTTTPGKSSSNGGGGAAAAAAAPNPPPLPTLDTVAGAYHPEFMFCGDCASCSVPPPPTILPPAVAVGGGGAGKKRGRHHQQKKRQQPPLGNGKDGNGSPVRVNGGGGGDIEMAQLDDDNLFGNRENDNGEDSEKGFIDDDNVENIPSSSSIHTTSHKSLIHVANVTTPGQILVINSILEPLPGVIRLVTKLSDRTVSVDHDPLIVGADRLVSSLREMGYDATISRDGALDFVESSNPTGVCRSTLYVEGICCASEVPAVKAIVKSLGSGVVRVAINITTRTVYVDHDPFRVPADMLAAALNSERFGAKVRKDGAIGSEQKLKPVEIQGSKGRSAFTVRIPNGRGDTNVLSEDDVKPLQTIISAVSGVSKIGVNVRDGIVYVDHDTLLTSAEDIKRALERGRYVVVIRVDAVAELKRLAGDREGKGSSVDLSSGENAMASLGIRKSTFVESTLYLPSMITLDSVRRLEKTMRRNYVKAQVRAFYPHIPSRTLKVEHDPTDDLNAVSAPDLVRLLRMSGFDEASVVVDGAVENLALPEMDYDETIEERGGMTEDASATSTWIGGLHFNVILSGICWFVSMLSIVEGWEDLKYAGIASVVFGIPPVAMKAWRTFRRCQFDANCMMVVAAFGALGLGEFDEAASVAFLFAVSEFLEARATSRARKALSAIVSLRPEHANLINRSTGEVTIVPASRIPVGSYVSVRTGDKVPADGVVEEGTSTVDESSLTGESRPISKEPDNQVSGGSINVGQTRLVVRTTSTVDDSAVSRLIRLVEEAQANRSPTEKLVDSFAKRYTPIVMSAAALMCTIPWAWGAEVGRYWTLNGLIIIVIACPCALTISTPVTYAAGLAATAQKGIIVKGGARLEALGNVKKIVFDKTGTITEGKFALTHLEVVGEARTRNQLLELLALMEGPSSHPLSATLVNAAKKEGIGAPVDVSLTEHTILKGEGVTARVDNHQVYVGNIRLFERLGLYKDLHESRRRSANDWSTAGGTVGFVGILGVGIVGMFCVSDKIRDEAKDVISTLMTDGYEVMMLTGDSDGAAKAVGRDVGLPHECIHSHLMPEDKLHFIGSIRGMSGSRQPVMCGSKELVLMVGDGVNDAPALAVADVGVAMGEGAALAMEMSDVTLMDSNLTKLTYSINMGSKVINTIRENIILSLLAKAVVVGLTFVGKMTLLWAIASDVGIMLMVTLNGMKLLPGRDGASLASERVVPVRVKRGGRYDELQSNDGLRGEGQATTLPEII